MEWRLGMVALMVGLFGLVGAGCARQGRRRLRAWLPAPYPVDKATVDACMICHSTREMQRGPVLDGLPAWYLEAQLKKFQTGQRGKNPKTRLSN